MAENYPDKKKLTLKKIENFLDKVLRVIDFLDFLNVL